MVRVFSGTLTSDMQLFNPNRDAKERFGQLYQQTGKTQKSLSEALPGDIVAIPKLKETHTGETLCTVASPIQFENIEPLPAVISYAIEAKEKGDEEKVFAGINKLLEEDPTLRLDRDPQTNEALLSGMGSVHIETTLDRLKRKFNVEVNLKTPKVPYRETIKGSVQGAGPLQEADRRPRPVRRHLAGDQPGRGLPARATCSWMRSWAAPFPASTSRRWKRASARPCMGGVLAGYPMVDVQVRLVDGSFHAVDSSEMAFKVAGSLGFKKGAVQCKPTLLEPIMLAYGHGARGRHGRRDGRHQLPARPGAGHGLQGQPSRSSAPWCPWPRCSPTSPSSPP